MTPLIATHGLSRNFGGLKAVDGVDFALLPGEIRALIGPNGAGKTTFVSLISGRVAAVVRQRSPSTAKTSPTCRRTGACACGIAYTFQITSVFANLTAYDNVALAVQRTLTTTTIAAARAPSTGVMAALERTGLADRREQLAANLSYGHQRLLEVAMGLALKPRLLILDEPTQGLSDGEIENFIALVREIAGQRHGALDRAQHGVASCGLPTASPCSNAGRILAEGAPEAIRANADGAGGLSREQWPMADALDDPGLDCFYGEVQVLHGLTLDAAQGEVLCLLGRNGAGKTTVLKAIMGLVPATRRLDQARRPAS